jgi:predicted MFS family arabinose efflux permease
MIKAAITQYFNNFKGFRREIWILTLVTFINRAGTMVLPFLSKYLKENLHFSYAEVGWIMVCFGMGSMLGSWLGGKLSDKIGFYKIMVFSLFTTGLLFFGLQFITSFWGLCGSVFILMTIADMFRPAMFVSIATYAKPENRVRALSLVRLAINLGFSAGPALGGLIIVTLGYAGLFWVDGASCIVAILVFVSLVKEKKKPTELNRISDTDTKVKSVFKDRIFWLFLFVCFSTALLFFQLFTTLPLYHNEFYNLSEFQTGLLMTFNGLLIFVLEMPIVSIAERRQINKLKILFWGSFLMALSFFVLLANAWVGVLLVSLIFMSLAEIFLFPFSNGFAMSRAPKGHEGRYMAVFTMSYSLAHIASSKVGLEIISHFGYQVNWLCMGLLGLSAMAVCYWVIQLHRAEQRL